MKARFEALAVLVITPLMLLALAGAGGAAEETPKSLPGARTVTAGEVKALMAEGAKVFDLRRKASYAEKHLPGAALIRYEEKSAKSASFDAGADSFELGQLPADKGAKLVFYGHGADGWKGYKASAAAVRAGYRNVHFFRGGFSEWLARGMPTE